MAAATVRANQHLHSSIAGTYEIDEPHFRPENREKTRKRLASICSDLSRAEVMVDFGCGTGFLEELAPERFSRIIGVDVTDAMLDILRQKKIPRVELLAEAVERTSLPSGVADLVTGYSVFDHFEKPLAVLVEAARLLRPGGVIYMDLVPNSEFWKGLRRIQHNPTELDPIVTRELHEVTNHAVKMNERYGIPKDVLAAAEPHKETSDGFSVQSIRTMLSESGFTEIKIVFEWFLGESAVLHGIGQEEALVVANHLRRLSPLSDHLFKYLWFTARRSDK